MINGKMKTLLSEHLFNKLFEDFIGMENEDSIVRDYIPSFNDMPEETRLKFYNLAFHFRKCLKEMEKIIEDERNRRDLKVVK